MQVSGSFVSVRWTHGDQPDSGFAVLKPAFDMLVVPGLRGTQLFTLSQSSVMCMRPIPPYLPVHQNS